MMIRSYARGSPDVWTYLTVWAGVSRDSGGDGALESRDVESGVDTAGDSSRERLGIIFGKEERCRSHFLALDKDFLLWHAQISYFGNRSHLLITLSK